MPPFFESSNLMIPDEALSNTSPPPPPPPQKKNDNLLRESPCEDQAVESTVYLTNFPDIQHTCVPSLLH